MSKNPPMWSLIHVWICKTNENILGANPKEGKPLQEAVRKFFGVTFERTQKNPGTPFAPNHRWIRKYSYWEGMFKAKNSGHMISGLKRRQAREIKN